MKRFTLVLMVCAAFLLAGCSTLFGKQTTGSGNLNNETRTVGEFTSLELSCSADVSLVQGGPAMVILAGEDNILPLIETKVVDRKLFVNAKPNTSFRTTKPLLVNIVVPVLTSLQVTGSGDVKMGKWMLDSLELISTGSGNILIDSLETPSLTARQSGSGDILILGGGGGSQTVTISGSGDYDARKMESREAEATTSGSGNITLWAVKNLSAHISGSGDIQYYGSPVVDTSDTGSGSVEKLGDKP